MRILLVVYDNGSHIHWFPQGLAYVAAVLKRAGHDIAVYSQDQEHFPDEHLTAYLDENPFDVVGVSVIGGYYQYRKLLRLSEAINRSRRRPFYVIGGHGPSPEPEYFLRKTGADAAVLGEGEVTAVELMAALGARRPLSGIPGIAFRDGHRVQVNPRRDLIAEVDSIPFPAYELFPMEYYRLLRMPHVSAADFVLPVLSGRGCTFQCNFCYRMDAGFRPRSDDAIVGEIRLLKKDYRIRHVTFSDELLMCSADRTVGLCEAFLKAGLDITWDCNGRLNYAQPEVLAVMKRAGCVYINYGIEAIDDRILRNMNKALTVKQVIAGVEATLKAGMSPGLNIIFGNIGEDRETLRKGVEFMLKYDDGSLLRTIRPVTPYPGSPLYEHAIEKGLLKGAEDFYEHKHLNSDLLAVNFTGLSDEEFHQALFEANSRLIESHFRKSTAGIIETARRLYVEKDAGFRGFRKV